MKKAKTASTVKNDAAHYLSAIAAQLKGKELFPRKVEKAKQFFNSLQKDSK